MAQLFRFLISGLFFSQETRVNAERLIATAVKSSSSVTWRGGPETLAFSFTGVVFKTEKNSPWAMDLESTGPADLNFLR